MAFDTVLIIRTNDAPSETTLPQSSSLVRVPPRVLISNDTMTFRFHSQRKLSSSQRSSVVSMTVLLCVVGQSLVPGIENWVPTASSPTTEVSGCCVAALARAASGCCCGPTAEMSCGCACGTKESIDQTAQPRKHKSTSQPTTIQSEICGCGGKHRPGMISSVEPAVLDSSIEIIALQSDELLLDAFGNWSGTPTPPPTPPPEFCV